MENPSLATTSSIPEATAPRAATPTAVYPWITAAQLEAMKLPEPEFVVPGIVPVGLSLLIGRYKGGKSAFALNMGFAVSTGRDFLNRPVDQANALYLGYEDSPNRISSRLRSITDQPYPEALALKTMPSEKLSDGLEDLLRYWGRTVAKPKLAIVDTLGRAMPDGSRGKDEYIAMTRLLGPLQELAMELEIGVLVVHHTAKPSKDGSRDIFDRSLGTSAIPGAADSMLALELHDRSDGPGARLHVRGRDAEPLKVDLAFDENTFSWYPTEKDPLHGVPSERMLVIQAVADGHVTPKAIAAHTGKSPNNVQNMLRYAVNSGHLKKVKTGQYDLTPAVAAALPGVTGVSDDPAPTTAVLDSPAS